MQFFPFLADVLSRWSWFSSFVTSGPCANKILQMVFSYYSIYRTLVSIAFLLNTSPYSARIRCILPKLYLFQTHFPIILPAVLLLPGIKRRFAQVRILSGRSQWEKSNEEALRVNFYRIRRLVAIPT